MQPGVWKVGLATWVLPMDVCQPEEPGDVCKLHVCV